MLKNIKLCYINLKGTSCKYIVGRFISKHTFLKKNLFFFVFAKCMLCVHCVLLVHVSVSADAEAVGTSGAFPHYSLCLTASEASADPWAKLKVRKPRESLISASPHSTRVTELSSRKQCDFLLAWWDLHSDLHSCASSILTHRDVIPVPNMKWLLRHGQTFGYSLFLEKHLNLRDIYDNPNNVKHTPGWKFQVLGLPMHIFVLVQTCIYCTLFAMQEWQWKTLGYKHAETTSYLPQRLYRAVGGTYRSRKTSSVVWPCQGKRETSS